MLNSSVVTSRARPDNTSMNKILVCLGLMTAILISFLFWFVPAAFFSSIDKLPKLRVTIPTKCEATCVAHLLQAQQVIRSEVGYRLYSFLDPVAQTPRAGVYIVSSGTSYRRLARLLARGLERQEAVIKIIEGWTLEDEVRAVSAVGATPMLATQTVAALYQQEFDFLSQLPPASTLEGYLFPDTYRVWKDELPSGLIKKQLVAFAARAKRLTDEAARQTRTLHEVVTLASIVEKEVAKSEDRRLVAGIFWQRLRIGMPLQSDATINYITRAGRTRPTLKDLDAPSLYNTYRNRGLPPGPISNPGADALEAALHPAQTEYRYFLTDEQGKSYFAKTFADHQRNRSRAFRSTRSTLGI